MFFSYDYFFIIFTHSPEKKNNRELYSRPALNTGKLGPLTSCFPFSYSITNLLNGKSTRNQLEQLFEKNKEDNVVSFFQKSKEIMKKMCESFFGEEMVASWERTTGEEEGGKEGEGEKLDYFYDMVGMCGFPAAHLSQDDEVLLFKTVMRGITGEKYLVTPYEIHAAFLLSEVRFYIIFFLSLFFILTISHRDTFKTLSPLSLLSPVAPEPSSSPSSKKTSPLTPPLPSPLAPLPPSKMNLFLFLYFCGSWWRLWLRRCGQMSRNSEFLTPKMF